MAALCPPKVITTLAPPRRDRGCRHPRHSYYLLLPFLRPDTILNPVGTVSSFGLLPPFLATSLQPPLPFPSPAGAAAAGCVSTTPLSASFLRRMNSSAKWRPSIVVELAYTASEMMV